MAIFGKSSIIEHVRSMKLQYWRIYQTQQDKVSGNYVASADFNNTNLGMEASMDALNLSLSRLTAGQYLLSCYDKPGQSKGGINTYIEVEGNGNSAVSGIGNVPASTFYLEGIGAVTADNFESAVEQKMRKMLDAEKEKNEKAALVKEVAELKRQARENEGGFQRGVMTIGSVLFATVSKTPAGKEFIGMARDLFFQAKAASRGEAVTTPGADVEEAHVVGDVGESEERLIAATEILAKDNPEFLEQIEMLAKLKQNDPDTFNQAVQGLKDFS